MLTALLTILACTGGNPATDDTGGGATDADTDTDTDTDRDGGTDGAASGCLADWTDGDFALGPDGAATQIHAAATWDGERLWAAWSSPDSGSHFDVWLSALDCDGTVLVAPVEATQTDDNELDPVLAAGDDGVLVAWTSDNGSGTSNLDIRTRVFDRDGGPRTDAVDLAAERDGVVVTGNATMPRVAVADGGFHLAGSWGHADATAFQAFAVDLDATAAPTGPAWDLSTTENGGQLGVDVAGGGTAHAWTESRSGDFADFVHLTSDGAVEQLGAGTRPSVVLTSAGPWVAWDDDAGTLFLRRPDGEIVEPDLGGGYGHSPRLAAHGDAMAMTWMVVESGAYGTVNLAWLDAEGRVEDTEVLADEVPGLYGSDVMLVDATHAFVVWTEGSNPDFQARGARRSRASGARR